MDDGQSAIEALCVSVQGDQQTQLLRQLLTAALTTAAGGAAFVDFGTCDAVCQDPNASSGALAQCINATDMFNQSGDNLPSPIDTGGAANPGPCQAAFATPCTVLDPSSCAVP